MFLPRSPSIHQCWQHYYMVFYDLHNLQCVSHIINLLKKMLNRSSPVIDSREIPNTVSRQSLAD